MADKTAAQDADQPVARRAQRLGVAIAGGALALVAALSVWRRQVRRRPIRAGAGRAEGKSSRDIQRCLKRVVARQLFKLLERYAHSTVDVLGIS